MTEAFSTRLRRAVGRRGRLCAGIDPHPVLLDAWGLPRDADGLAAFAETCAAAFGPAVAAVKPQVALFEEYGSAGIAVLERTIGALREAGALVIADAKRGDIGSTMAAYGRAWLAPGSPLASDAMTAAPYLGFGSLTPAIDLARDAGNGVFVLARTSNPDGAGVQTARVSDDAPDAAERSVAQALVDAAETEAPTVGLVVGATRAHGLDLSGFGGPILAPGLGAQGAGAADLRTVFGDATELLVPNCSRALLRRGPDAGALRSAALRLTEEIESALA